MSRPNLINDVFALILEGKSNVDIGKILNRSISSINRYMGLILKKYDVKTRNELYVKLANEDKKAMLQDWGYEEEESGRTETLVQALDKIELLEKKLNLAIFTLKRYADEDNWDGPDEMHQEWFTDSRLDGGFKYAQEAIETIEGMK